MSEEEQDDRAADLEAAFDEVEGDAGNSEELQVQGEGQGQQSEESMAAEVDEESAADEGDVQQEASAEQDEGADEAAEDTGSEEETGRAPVSWKPEEREAWKDVPAAARQAVQRREAEINSALQESAGARRFTSDFAEMVQPYMPFIAAEGSNPMQAASYLFQTAAGLRVGTPQQKAGIIVEMIGNFGIDVGMIDRMLVGEEAGDASPQDIEAMIDQRIQMATGSAQQQAPGQPSQQDIATANQSIEQFAADPKNEFFHDVSDQMATLLMTAAQNGQSMNLQQAYDLAVNMREDLQTIITNRGAGGDESSRAARRQRAASSLKPGGKVGGDQPASTGNSRVDDISAAWDSSMGDG